VVLFTPEASLQFYGARETRVQLSSVWWLFLRLVHCCVLVSIPLFFSLAMSSSMFLTSPFLPLPPSTPPVNLERCKKP
jgi:hypothetical protein